LTVPLIPIGDGVAVDSMPSVIAATYPFSGAAESTKASRMMLPEPC
jgi:hypothetical protein